MRGSLGMGLIIGVAVGLATGSGAMYLALRPPWESPTAPAAPFHGEISTPSDIGVGKSKPKRRPSRRGTVTGSERGWGDNGTDIEAGPPLVSLSAADRALEWRGDDTSRPPQQIDMGEGATGRSLDDGEIRAAIEAHAAPIKSCLVQSATNTDLRGTITMKLVIDGTGQATKTKVSAFRYMFERGLLACIRRAVSQLRFPATGAPTLVTVPMEVKPTAGQFE